MSFCGYLKCFLFVFLAPLVLVLIWRIFAVAVNPLLAELIVEAGIEQSAIHLNTIDAISFTYNYHVRLIWGIAALVYFIRLGRAKKDAPLKRRIAMAVYLAPYLLLATASVIAALVQDRAHPVARSNDGQATVDCYVVLQSSPALNSLAVAAQL